MITSRTNQVVRYVRSLHRRRTRQEERAFIVEGERAIGDALAALAVPTHVILRGEWWPSDRLLAESLSRLSPSTLFRVEPGLFRQLSDTVSPAGILAIFNFPDPPAHHAAPLIVVADGLRDPGNLGTLIRTAAAAGATALLSTQNTVDAFNPKAVRAGMGAHFRLPLWYWDDDAAPSFLSLVPNRVLAESGDHRSPDVIDWTGSSLLIIGGEARGPGIWSRGLANHRVAIPLNGGVESLNASVAAAVILFEAARQRRNLAESPQSGDFRRSSY